MESNFLHSPEAATGQKESFKPKEVRFGFDFRRKGLIVRVVRYLEQPGIRESVPAVELGGI